MDKTRVEVVEKLHMPINVSTEATFNYWTVKYLEEISRSLAVIADELTKINAPKSESSEV